MAPGGGYKGNSGGFRTGGFAGTNGSWSTGDQGDFSGYSNNGGSMFGFSADTTNSYSGGRGRGKRNNNYNRGNYQSNYNYHNNPEWLNDGYGNDYGNGGYGNGYGDGMYDNGGFGNDYYYNNPFPFRGRGNFRGRGRGQNLVWQRGMPRWTAGPQKEFFKKKWQNEKKIVAKPAAVALAAADKPKKKKFRHNEGRVLKFQELMTLKNKYRSVRQNRHLSPDDQLTLVLLKRITNDLSEGDVTVYCINFSKLASRHPSALKLFAYEAKKLLDAKYDQSSEEEKQKMLTYLKETKDDVIEGFKKVYKSRAATEDMEAKEKLLDHYIKKISGETFTEDDIPKDDDFLFNKNHSRLEEDFVNELKYDFVFNSYEVFKFKPDEQKTPTKDLKKRLAFHLQNPIIPFILVESVRAKTLVKAVPPPVNKYILPQSQVHQDKNESCLSDVVNLMNKNGQNVVTPLAQYIDASAESSTEIVRDFADCILMFDKFATYIRYRLLEHSPNILLSKEFKEKIFNELVDKVYREALDILRKNERFDTAVFVDMEGDPPPVKTEKEEVTDATDNGEQMKTE